MLDRILRIRKSTEVDSTAARCGFISRSDMELCVAKERSRCDRGGPAFCFVVLSMLPCKYERNTAMLKMIGVVSRRLRMTDERCVWSPIQIALMLPQTDASGLQYVLESLTKLAADLDLFFEVETMQYPSDTDKRSKGDGQRQPEAVPALQSVVADVDVRDSMTLFSTDYPAWKRQADILFAATGLVLAIPVVVLSAIAIKLSSPGPVLYRQQRVGYRGKKFYMYKLRSMVVSADQQKEALREWNERDGPAFKMANDPRVTLVGRFLRATGVDEIPQLWNVIRGDMAIVGPRPLPCDEDAQCLPWHRRRLETKPGLTCYWQTSKNRNVCFDDWMRMDLQYFRKRSMFQDAKILVRTVFAVFLGRVGH